MSKPSVVILTLALAACGGRQSGDAPAEKDDSKRGDASAMALGDAGATPSNDDAANTASDSDSTDDRASLFPVPLGDDDAMADDSPADDDAMADDDATADDSAADDDATGVSSGLGDLLPTDFLGGLDTVDALDPSGDAAPAAGVGAGCETDADCEGSLSCHISDLVPGGKVAGGFCTTPCASDPSICSALDPSLACLSDGGTGAFCFQACQLSDGSPTATLKCPGADVLRICALSEPSTGLGYCVPHCFDDTFCDDGSYCDSISGLCVEGQSSGRAIGELCTVNEDCAGGLCQGTGAQGVCSASCPVAPVRGGCGYQEGDDVLEAACLPILADSQYLDQGLCFATCDTDADCGTTEFTCRPFGSESTAAAYGAAGVCYWTDEVLNNTPPAAGAPVGESCTADDDCGSGLFCLEQDEAYFGSGSIAEGLCTARCEEDPPLCHRLSATAECFLQDENRGYCLDLCQAQDGGGFDSGKCDSNPLRICFPLTADGVGACLPNCLDDVACETGICDLNSGLCRDEVRAGEPIGGACTSDADCQGGYCADDGAAGYGICSAGCAITGTGLGCGRDENARSFGLCVPTAEGSQYLDLGICLPTCDTDADCAGGTWQCSESEEIAQLTGRLGSCEPRPLD